MRALFLDTETTGLPIWERRSHEPEQPHLVQLAALLMDLDSRAVLQQVDFTIRPDDWEIPADVAELHGITNDRAREIGIAEGVALTAFLALWERAEVRIAHNEPFDARIVRIACKRYWPAEADRWSSGKRECTARMSTPILRLPPTERMRAVGRSHYKTPNLREAYSYFTGRELERAHTALADVRACAHVYFACQRWHEENSAITPA